ncbi:MAG: hypothetical protein AB1665_04275 [Candidatus Thermoplasmatota archaeon]
MEPLFFLAAAVGFAPAIGVLWHALHRYSYPYTEKTFFDDRKVFFLLAVGMILGTFLSVMETALYPFFTTSGIFILSHFLAIFVVLFPLLEEGGKLAVLNFPSLRRRFDNVFYGIALGTGFSAVWITQITYTSLHSSRGQMEALWLAGVVLFSLALALFHAVTGAIIGAGCARGTPFSSLAAALGVHAVINLLMAPSFALGMLWFSIPPILIIALLLYLKLQRMIPESLPPDLRSELRRAARRAMQDARRTI